MRIRVWYVPYAYGINTRMVQNINSKTISKVVKIKDLGIILSSNLNWDYLKITGRAYKFLGLLRRTFTTDSILAKKRLYTYVFPL